MPHKPRPALASEGPGPCFGSAFRDLPGDLLRYTGERSEVASTSTSMLLHPSRRACISRGWRQATHLRRNHAAPAAEKRLQSKRTGNGRYTVVAIESSCDDTSVAVVGVKDVGFDEAEDSNVFERVFGCPSVEHRRLGLDVYFHEKITANNDAYTGIHPLVALESHRANLAPLLQKALVARNRQKGRIEWHHTGDIYESDVVQDDDDIRSEDSYAPHGRPLIPEFVAVTRGPGMRSNLSIGLEMAKGLAAAWNVPLVGVHHMQAHALTPRLLVAQANWGSLEEGADGNSYRHLPTPEGLAPAFPFLSVLVSGGHTMLIDSKGLTEHTTLAETQDIAIGDFLDKAARAILPSHLLRPPFGAALEQFAFHSEVKRSGDVQKGVGFDEEARAAAYEEFVQPRDCSYDYTPPARRQDELESRPTGWGWALTPPLAESKGGQKSSRRMVYSFAGLLTSIERLAKRQEHVSLTERQVMAREAQRVAFEHLASRILLHLSTISDWQGDTIVVSGGVASNKFLRHLLRGILDARGYGHVKLSFPPVELCTDNALMIAWAGIEMYEAGYTSSLDIGPIRKWSMDPKAPDGGILGVGGWLKDGKPIPEG
ncbi:hypothetical protein LTR36_002928 [Oleoguttula mirabilis]|uniref:Gcp-like domain-containing protein n=1 Tax=Oleoguttula mirabilis TaxID=1507867 RepID=A0AAV9JJZ6_9PEZI|nr:hypothetical protein LTR36_002928 [Oleoguttula mirabilis]